MDRAVVIGLDGAAWHLLDPLIEKGVMPRLAQIKERGAAGRLRSTIPTYTPPAWTSAATGVNPGRHGIYGFLDGHAQSEHQELMHSGKIDAPTIWEIANDQGARVGVYNLPLTYPPRPLDGWMVSGMMTPGFGEQQKGFASWSGPGGGSELESKILSWVPDFVLDLHANYEQDWRDESLARRGLASVKQREHVLRGLLELDPPDLVFSVLETPDRLQHVYYRYMDPNDPLSSSDAAKPIRSVLRECFAAIDSVVGLLDDYAGPNGGVLVCSDHGFTAWEVSVHTNALLAQWGHLILKSSARAMRSGLARRLVPVAKRFLPRRMAREAKGRTFAAIDWSKTVAFASPIPQQGVYLNLEGRERFGVVAPADAPALLADIKRRFEELRSASGRPLTDEVFLGSEVFTGDAREGAPDLLPVLQDHRYELDDEVFHVEPFTDVSDLPRGVHHPDGIGVVAGPGSEVSAAIDGSIMDVTPTLLYQAGLKVPEGLDGSVLTQAFTPNTLEKRPIQTTAPLSSSAKDEASPYSPEEEAIIEESLRGLGYL